VFKRLLPLFVFILLITVDQLTKSYFKYLHDQSPWTHTDVISGFFSFVYTFNTGAAWSFLSGKEWAQTFFKVLTAVAIVVFYIYYIFACKKNYALLRTALLLIIAGTLGNFIDRLAYNGVVDFLSFTFGSYGFPIFNLADAFMCIGVALLLIHYLFFDNNALFGKRKKDGTKISD